MTGISIGLRTVLVAMGALIVGATATATTLTRYPHVNIVTPTSVTIAWKTNLAGPGTVVYSEDLSYSLSASEATSDTMHAVTINGLDPATLYYYRVVAGPDTLTPPNDYFRTAPTPSPDAAYHFAVFGDIGKASAEQIAVAGMIDDFAPDFALLTGDIIYDGGEPQNFDPQYFQIYRPTIAHTPFYTSLGNHDLYLNNGAAYQAQFVLPKNSATGTERYYSFDYGNAHIVALEVTQEDVPPGATMLAWLDQDLAATTQLWKFVFFHVPAYSNSSTHGGDATIAASVEPIFMNRGVDVVFQGHNHFYTRTYPLQNGVVVNAEQEPNYTNPSGPIWIVTGGGGRSLYPLDPLEPFEAFSMSAFHFTSVFVNGPVLALTAIDINHTVIDQLSILKTPTTAITMADFVAEGRKDGVRLSWRRVDGGDEGGFNVYRTVTGAAWDRLNSALLRGGPVFEYVDESAAAGVVYSYRLGVVDGQGAERLTPAVTATLGAPLRFAIERPRPNPSRGNAVLSLTLDRPARTRATIVDVAGRRIRTLWARDLPAGPHALVWDGRDDAGRPASSGIYFAVVQAGDREARTRVAFLR